MRGWQAVATADGAWTLRHPVHAQACHSLSGAWQQARERYARPCRLRELALERARTQGSPRVRLLDIGTGIGLNLAAALEALSGTGADLAAVSLELDPDVLASARELPAMPPGVETWLAPVREALAAPAGTASSARGLELTLVLGDARDTLAALAPSEPFDAVFLDPFSPGVDAALWSAQFLRQVALRMAPWAVLSTYSSSIAVRAALQAAGLVLGEGPRVGAKASGTLASLGGGLPALPGRVLRRLQRAYRGAAAGESLGSDSESRPGIA